MCGETALSSGDIIEKILEITIDIFTLVFKMYCPLHPLMLIVNVNNAYLFPRGTNYLFSINRH